MGFGRFSKAEENTDTENLEDSDETEGPRTASLMMIPKIMKRPQRQMDQHTDTNSLACKQTKRDAERETDRMIKLL